MTETEPFEVGDKYAVTTTLVHQDAHRYSYLSAVEAWFDQTAALGHEFTVPDVKVTESTHWDPETGEEFIYPAIRVAGTVTALVPTNHEGSTP